MAGAVGRIATAVKRVASWANQDASDKAVFDAVATVVVAASSAGRDGVFSASGHAAWAACRVDGRLLGPTPRIDGIKAALNPRMAANLDALTANLGRDAGVMWLVRSPGGASVEIMGDAAFREFDADTARQSAPLTKVVVEGGEVVATTYLGGRLHGDTPATPAVEMVRADGTYSAKLACHGAVVAAPPASPALDCSPALRWAIGDNIDNATASSRRAATMDGYTVVWLDAAEVMAHTGSDYALDIADPKGGRNAIGNRVAGCLEHWERGGWMDPPELGYDDWFGCLHFGNGRHRMVAAARLGHPLVPVIVPTADLADIQSMVTVHMSPNDDRTATMAVSCGG